MCVFASLSYANLIVNSGKNASPEHGEERTALTEGRRQLEEGWTDGRGQGTAECASM